MVNMNRRDQDYSETVTKSTDEAALAAPPYSAKITQRQLENILINEGIIQAAAIDDPEGYDGGITELAVTIATQQINELISTNAKAQRCRDAERPKT